MNRGREGDPEFLESLRRRDNEAIEAAIAMHARALYTISRALGFDSSESEDLVQDTLTTFLETLDRFEGRSSVRTWLVGILYRKTLERRRARARESQADPIEGVLDSRFSHMGRWARPPADVERLLASKEAAEAVAACLEQVPPQQRAAFILRELEQLDTATICKILDVSVTNLGVLLYRARNRMRECLEARGITAS
jgi:RNA polymerase sigma-70 factor, ECF subfamily